MWKGGNHLLNNEEVFSFELHESLFFERGQEVSEMLGISLEPEISIQQFNEYVSIRGVIELHGEYQKVPANEDNKPDLLELEDNHSYRYLEKIKDTAAGRAEFLHRFPVEISVPTYRIPDINNVSVRIDTFDYEIPDNRELNLKSTIAIHGIKNVAELPRDEQTADALTHEEDNLESFEFEMNNESFETNEEINQVEEVEELEDASEEDKKRWKYTKSQTFKEFFTDDQGDPKEVDLLDEEVEEVEEAVEEVLEKEVDVLVTDTTGSQEQAESVSDLEADVETHDKDRDETLKGMDYIADMFRTDEESEEFTRLQLCIVQEKDTLETIAERYQVPKLQLVKQNRLEDDHLLEGQLLSIPYKKNKD
jgi:stage VI sporulation protein D